MTKAEIEKLLLKYVQAEMAILEGQAYEMNGRKLTLANLSEVSRNREKLERRLNRIVHRGKPKFARFK